MNKRYFWQNEVPQNVKNNIRFGGIASLISAAMTLLVALSMNPFLLIDAVFAALLGLGILLGKSRICAVICVVYYTVSKLLQFLGMSGLGDAFSQINATSFITIVFFFSAYVCSVHGTFRYHALYKEYRLNLDTAMSAPPPVWGQPDNRPDDR